jgi:hypothetical protein
MDQEVWVITLFRGEVVKLREHEALANVRNTEFTRWLALAIFCGAKGDSGGRWSDSDFFTI